MRIDFFNYGEAFLHKRAVEMCEYIKTRFPHIYLYTSTNGLAFTEAQARRLVHSGIDEVTFSIDGATQESYVQVPAARPVRRRDREPARDGRREAPRRPRPAVPQLALHPVHLERQRRGDGRCARQLAADIGVDRLCWEITDHPENAYSRRFVPGLAGLRGHPARDLGRQQPRQRHSRRDAAGAHRRADARARACRSSRAPDRALHVRTRVHNLSTRPFPAQATYGRRLVRLGAQLCAADGTLIDRDFARAWLPRRSARARAPTSPIELPPLREPGRYALKFDLVSEGVDWFERCGSETTTQDALGRR